MNNLIQNKKIWNDILNELKIVIDDEIIFDIITKNSEILNINDNKIEIAVNSFSAKKILLKDYYNLILQNFKKYLNTNIDYDIVFYIQKKNKINNNHYFLFGNTEINDKMTFENFIVGDSNKKAFQASLYICDDNNHKYFNPLFLYSKSGLGKTHLLNAIYNKIKKNKKVLYTTTIEFFNEYKCILNGEYNEKDVINSFKTIDILLIDDIQFISNKENFQEFFFIIFDYFLTHKKIVVISSDKHPYELINLTDRLKTRFYGGLTLAIASPEIDTSIKIIKLYLNKEKIIIDNQACHYIAIKFSNNVRNLINITNEILNYTINEKINFISIENIFKIFKNVFIIKDKKNKKNVEDIINAVIKYYSLTISQLFSDLKEKRIVLARRVITYLINKILKKSFREIAIILNRKDHMNLYNGFKIFKKELKNNNQLKNEINIIENFIFCINK